MDSSKHSGPRGVRHVLAYRSPQLLCIHQIIISQYITDIKDCRSLHSATAAAAAKLSAAQHAKRARSSEIVLVRADVIVVIAA